MSAVIGDGAQGGMRPPAPGQAGLSGAAGSTNSPSSQAVAPAGVPDAPRMPGLVLAVLACTCSSIDVWVLMTMAFPLLERLCAPAVTVQAAVAAAGYALVALVALKAPRKVSPMAFSAESAALLVLGSVVWWWGMRTGDALVATLGVCAAHFGCAWPRILAGAALCALGNKRDFVLVAFLGEGLGALARCLIPQTLPMGACLAVAGLAELFMLAAGHAAGVPVLKAALRGTSPQELDVTNPESFVSPSHRLFILIAFFEFIHGISLAEKTQVILAANVVVVVALACGGAWVFARHRMEGEDILLVTAALLMLGGFILRPLTPFESVASSALSFAGAAFSWVLIWTVFASVGASNPAGALWALGAGYTMQALGLEAGSLLGRWATWEWFAASESVANCVNAVVVLAFIGYLLVGMRGFSFSEAFAGIVPVEPLRVSGNPAAHIERSCEELARAQGLSSRELDVMRLLAQGKSGPEIQEALVVSRNTVKTHVRHIYRKLGVHSQQELVDLVAHGRVRER